LGPRLSSEKSTKEHDSEESFRLIAAVAVAIAVAVAVAVAGLQPETCDALF
jgi:hypothetical protein